MPFSRAILDQEVELPREFRRQFEATGEFEATAKGGEGERVEREEETDFVCTTFRKGVSR